MRLPVVQCARGSTSLESFHFHLARFIPGSSVAAVNFQANLLDGINRWNADRSRAAIDLSAEPLQAFDLRIQEKVNALSEAIHGHKVFPNYRPPAKYTGEFFGVEYLYSQSGLQFQPEDLDQEIDEGFEDYEHSPLHDMPVVLITAIKS